MTDTVTKYQCTTCGETFEYRKECRSHTSRHRRKDALDENTTPDDFIREIEVEPDTSEAGSLYDQAENEPGEHNPEVLVEERDEPQTREKHLWDYV